MVRNCEKISISLHKDVLRRVEEISENENRKRSNVIEAVLREYFDLNNRKQRPMARRAE